MFREIKWIRQCNLIFIIATNAFPDATILLNINIMNRSTQNPACLLLFRTLGCRLGTRGADTRTCASPWRICLGFSAIQRAYRRWRFHNVSLSQDTEQSYL